ncbi:MAG: bifunctional acetate--CoA ligase family protein/GNAT family N-acetyltransferase [Thermodesulfobacteriota bacterium]|nr:bifunctional acetate--CoA ligase family protein/GNAT family N-acetyltransferase [Thermodesulfobacteriota bacterium]
MGIYNLEKMFHPKSVAVVGASQKKGNVGCAIMQNLIHGEYPGNIYPVNPNYKTIFDKPACATLSDINTPPDLVIIATPIHTAPAIVKQCVSLGAGGAVIISAGGKEAGAKGVELETAIKKEAKDGGLRIIGPNCVGIISSRSKLNASFTSQMPIPGKMAFISQSGAICSSILDLSIKENIGFSYFVSIGDMLDVDFADLIDFLGGEQEVSSIVMYVESLCRFRNFMSAARSVSMVKPIIALKAGRTRAGALAAASHTGAMAGEDSIYDAAFKRAGILRVKTFEELFDCSELLAKQPTPSGPGLAIITNAGGLGVMAADALSDYGYEPVALATETIEKLDVILPPYWSKRNPIDMLGDVTPDLYRKVVEICLFAKEINGLLIMSAPQALTDMTEVAASLVDLFRNKPFPIFTSWVGGAEMQTGREIFNQAGIPAFNTPERAVRAFMDIYHNSRNIQTLQQIPARLPKKLEFDREKAKQLIQEKLATKNHLVTELEAKALLSAYGIPVNRMEQAASKEEAVKKAKDLGFPVVLKVNSRDITHKSDAKGVCLNLTNEKEVQHAFETIWENAIAYNPKAKIEGVTIQPMAESCHYELILGAKKDRDFGPVILFGMGGTLTEVLKDSAIALPPLNRLLAKNLMKKTKIYQLLEGYRNIPPADIELLEEILIRLAQLVIDFPEIEELDINPLLVKGDDACVVDARVLLKPSQIQSPLHLVISPYPDRYEGKATTAMGVDIFVRPIRPEDAPLLVELFESLSPRSVYMRFFNPLKRLPHSMLARFTQIDYDREIALVALSKSQLKEKMLGVARVINERNQKHAEFSVVVGDQWQGKGIGSELLKRCLTIAKERNLETVWGSVLTENSQMLKLGKKLGFKIGRIQGSNEYELKIDLTKTDNI